MGGCSLLIRSHRIGIVGDIAGAEWVVDHIRLMVMNAPSPENNQAAEAILSAATGSRDPAISLRADVHLTLGALTSMRMIAQPSNTASCLLAPLFAQLMSLEAPTQTQSQLSKSWLQSKFQLR